MAVIYYPKNQLMFIRDTVTSASNYESVYLNVQPNTIIYFETSSYMQSINASTIPITASWAMTASISTVLFYTSTSFASSSISASYSNTASFATTSSYLLNYVPTVSSSWASQSLSSSYANSASYAAGAGATLPYTLITASATNYITIDLTLPEQYTILTAAASYSFAAINAPSSASVSTVALFISNSGAASIIAIISSIRYYNRIINQGEVTALYLAGV
jgi:hypothetical protein